MLLERTPVTHSSRPAKAGTSVNLKVALPYSMPFINADMLQEAFCPKGGEVDSIVTSWNLGRLHGDPRHVPSNFSSLGQLQQNLKFASHHSTCSSSGISTISSEILAYVGRKLPPTTGLDTDRLLLPWVLSYRHAFLRTEEWFHTPPRPDILRVRRGYSLANGKERNSSG